MPNQVEANNEERIQIFLTLVYRRNSLKSA